MNEIDELAQALYREADPSGNWAADDEISRLYYRRQAQQRATAEMEAQRYKEFSENV